jgi:hypothetical protein
MPFTIYGRLDTRFSPRANAEEVDYQGKRPRKLFKIIRIQDAESLRCETHVCYESVLQATHEMILGMSCVQAE